MTNLVVRSNVVIFGTVLGMFLASCGGQDRNVAACGKANTKINDAISTVRSMDSQGDQVSVIAEMAAIFTVLSNDLSDLADSTEGDVRSELNAASSAAKTVSDTATSLDVDGNAQAISTFTDTVAVDGPLDNACQAAGSDPFTPVE